MAHSLSYLYTGLANPGIPTKNRKFTNQFATVGIKRFKVCSRCLVIMDLDRKTSHCNNCDICVEGIEYSLIFNIYYRIGSSLYVSS